MSPPWESSEVELVLAARSADLPGGLHVLRALPQAQRRMVGPFVFLDQMGPAVFSPGQGMSVLPHPHIGLSTVTYLFEGEGMHRDSLGTIQRILPGDVNWMTAGRGISHSERTPPELLQQGGTMFGIQIWVALPKVYEEGAPTFVHHSADTLPEIEDGGARIRLVAGALYGARSPVKTHSELFYAVANLEEGAVVRLTAEHDERAAYVAQGSVEVAGGVLQRGELAVFQRGAEVLLRAVEPSRVLLLGGEPLEGPRHIWWNFVSSSKERIEQAKADWREQRFGSIPGETEFIPLPSPTPRPVNYP
ncbi:pirin family protein [Hyalangium rubrum]|uniref:Pirin family protein n=1 Tax=Hyalangium rubrum TaxID=3103134 RepID=A0ABU5H468_9BACT|nr:pirin family protein [Hyalangium sp. s54d21]MDY7227917.1 pirin family protein [Hyalangium sp. s54d21]